MIKLEHLPSDPGCYLYKNKEGRIIYIGKAKNLKKRVSSYFLKKDHDAKTQALVDEIEDVEFFATTNEVEALVLENNLIKKHMPRYNIDLKDSNRYAHILVSDEKYPRLLVARDKSEKGKYYGPFTSAESRDQVLKVLRSTFMIRTCPRLPKRVCLRHHIGLCSAPCIGNISEEVYGLAIKNAEIFLKGNVEELIKRLKGDMSAYSSQRLYEKSRILRDKISALESLSEKQRFEKDKRYDEDIIDYILSENKVYLIVFNITRGILAQKHEFVFDFTEGFLGEFIAQYYSQNDVPREIILPQEIDDRSILPYLERIRKGKVEFTIPKKGDKLALLELVKKNIEISFFRESKMVSELRKELHLNANPNIIECFDISNISGSLSVGSMVQFRNGKPDKANYRRFRIKTVEGIDDTASIKEIVGRRYSRLKMEKSEMPDLIVIDGGKGQLGAAMEAIKEIGLRMPIIALAKRFEEIYTPAVVLRLDRNSKGLRLLQQIRNEAHRFAISYHRLLRSKEMIG